MPVTCPGLLSPVLDSWSGTVPKRTSISICTGPDFGDHDQPLWSAHVVHTHNLLLEIQGRVPPTATVTAVYHTGTLCHLAPSHRTGRPSAHVATATPKLPQRQRRTHARVAVHWPHPCSCFLRLYIPSETVVRRFQLLSIGTCTCICKHVDISLARSRVCQAAAIKAHSYFRSSTNCMPE